MPTISEEDETESMATNEVQCKLSDRLCRVLTVISLLYLSLVFPLSEKDDLLKNIADLKTQIEEAKHAVPVPPSDSLLRGEETKDIISKYTE